MDAYKNPSAFLSACKNYEGSGDRKSSSVFSETKMILSANIIEDTVIMEEIYLVMNEIVLYTTWAQRLFQLVNME